MGAVRSVLRHAGRGCWHAQEILEIEQLEEENQGMELTEDNVETVLDEIRPYLVGEQPHLPLPPLDSGACSAAALLADALIQAALPLLHIPVRLRGCVGEFALNRIAFLCHGRHWRRRSGASGDVGPHR